MILGMGETASLNNLSEIAKKVRKNIIEMTYQAGSGHPGGSLSATDLLVGLYFGGLMGKEDKFILSAGHVCPAWYAVLNQKLEVGSEKLGSLRKIGSPLQGHPYKKMAEFVETSTGSLGQGISVSVGMALGKKIKKTCLPAGREGGFVWVLSSDGEQEEGQVWEAAMLAAKHNLDNLCLIIDRNKMQIGGETEKITQLEPLKQKYEAFGWRVLEIDGHDFKQILSAYEMVKKDQLTEGDHKTPVVVIARTVRGKGVSFMENQVRYHACTLTEEECEKAIKELT